MVTPPKRPATDVTQLLQRWEAGDGSAVDELIPLVYDELRALAARRLRGEREGHTLQATALVNEAYLRMVGSAVPLQGRAHFFALAAKIMRRILVDHARTREAAKRGGGAARVSLTDARLFAASSGDGDPIDVLAIHDALDALESRDERKARVIELSVFGGLTQREIAESLSISPATVERDLRFARAWMAKRLKD
jgi:RNA polymerase sigma factor (TIGR02999 family)